MHQHGDLPILRLPLAGALALGLGLRLRLLRDLLVRLGLLERHLLEQGVLHHLLLEDLGALVGLVIAHLMALHEVGSNNPDGIEIKKHKDPKTGIPLDGIPFHPYYTVKDIVGTVVFLAAFSIIVFFAPEMEGYFL